MWSSVTMQTYYNIMTVFPFTFSPIPHLSGNHLFGLCFYESRLFVRFVFLESVYKCNHNILVFLCLTYSLSIILSKSISVVANSKVFFIAVWYSIIYMCVYMYIHTYIYHIIFIHSCINWHLGYFSILAVANSIAMNIWVHMSLWTSIFIFFG